MRDDDLNEYERFGLLDSNNKWKAGGMHAIKAVKDYWASGDYMPLELQPLARKMLENGRGSLLPSKATRANFLKAGLLLLRKEVKSAKDASLAVGKKENWFVSVRLKYPGMWKQMELDYYRDLEETTERAKWEAKQKRIQSAADLAEMASAAHKTILEDADVAPAVKMTAVKHVDDVLGVVGKEGLQIEQHSHGCQTTKKGHSSPMARLLLMRRWSVSDLLPCPLCGARVAMAQWHTATNHGYYVACPCTDDMETEERAALAWNRRSPAWRSIETVPRDGTWVLLFPGPGNVQLHIGRYIENHWLHLWQLSCGCCKLTSPAHWMPLPDPPPKE